MQKVEAGAAEDGGEHVGQMEPLLIAQGSRHRTQLTDLALDLAQKSAGFRRSLPESLLASLADLVRAMNCYYSNLIEGHDTHPVDIERALKGDYSDEPENVIFSSRPRRTSQFSNGSTAAGRKAAR